MEGRVPPNAGQALFTTRFAWSRPKEFFNSLFRALPILNTEHPINIYANTCVFM